MKDNVIKTASTVYKRE